MSAGFVSLDKQWRYQVAERLRAAGEWSAWVGDYDLCERMAKDPDFGTGVIQIRDKPKDNRIIVQPFEGGFTFGRPR